MMKVMAALTFLAVTASASACQPDMGPGADAEDAVAAASEAGIDPKNCHATLNASVRGVTGSFQSPEAAARSVSDLPEEGRLVRFEADEDSAKFGWIARGLLTHIIDAHRGDGGWTVGSYQKCGGRS
ncbi:MAG: hypothetical protein ACLGH4_00315 [Actinomycetes bacterium]